MVSHIVCACVVRLCVRVVCGLVCVCWFIVIPIYVFMYVSFLDYDTEEGINAEVYLSKTKLQLVFYSLRLRGESVLEEVGVCFKLQI